MSHLLGSMRSFLEVICIHSSSISCIVYMYVFLFDICMYVCHMCIRISVLEWSLEYAIEFRE